MIFLCFDRAAQFGISSDFVSSDRLLVLFFGLVLWLLGFWSLRGLNADGGLETKIVDRRGNIVVIDPRLKTIEIIRVGSKTHGIQGIKYRTLISVYRDH